VVGERHVFGPHRRNARGSTGAVELQQFIEQRADPPPHRRIDGRHGAKLLWRRSGGNGERGGRGCREKPSARL
jgi:hypothetical protein